MTVPQLLSSVESSGLSLAGEMSVPSTIKYNVGSGAYTFKVPAYSATPSDCAFTARYILQDKYERCPVWISPQCPTNIVAGDTITINTSDSTLIGTSLDMQLIVLDQYNALINDTQSFTVSFITGGLTAIGCSNCPLAQVNY